MPQRALPLFLKALTALLPAAGLLLATPAAAQKRELYEGYLCCNFIDDGSWVNDINYRRDNARIIPAGTPARVVDYGRWRIHVEVEGRRVTIGNDYSRNIPLEDWARRVVVEQDPTQALAGAPAKVQQAVREARLVPGMTREQVLLAVGWPPLSYNKDLQAPLWTYWANRSYSYQVFWDEQGRVDNIFGPPEARKLVVLE